jgi:hypothetical protein
VQSSVQDNMKGYGTLQGGGFNTYKGALLRGTQVSPLLLSLFPSPSHRSYLSIPCDDSY